MTRKSHAVIGLAAILVVATAAIVGMGAAGAQSSADSPGQQSIAVSATGSDEASPNQAVVRVSVTAEADDSATVRDELATGAQELRTALDDLGVDYETVRYTIEQQDEPRERRERSGAPEQDRPDYRGAHGFQVTLDDTDAVGSVIDAAADAGAEVNGVTFTLSDERRTELRDEAIQNAMTDARTQATTLAAAGNLTVTNVDSIEASQRHYRPVQYEATADAGGAAPQTVVEGGDVSVSYDVQVVYNATTA